MRVQKAFSVIALALAAPLAACASTGSGEASGYSTAAVGAVRLAPAHHDDDGLLPEPPADAKAGQCYAKVVVPGQPVYGPPQGPHLKWVQSPPPPGAVGPIWCQVWEQGYQPTVTLTPERYGWIRVICDKDATTDRIGHIQHRLHDWGYYNGEYGGRYDETTAAAVTRFQDTRGIKHGGYLSLQTMEALETAPPAPSVTYGGGYGASLQQETYAASAPVYPAPVYPAPVYPAPVYPGPVYPGPVYPGPVYQPPVYQPPVYAPQPCGQCAVPPPCGPAPCQGQGYGGQGGVRGYSVQRYLSWSGKAGF